jgi:putative transposase
VNRTPEPIEWLTNNGSRYTGGDTRAFAALLIPRTRGEQPPFKRHGRGVRSHFQARLCPHKLRPDAQSVLHQLPGGLHDNEVHTLPALRYRLLRESSKTARLCTPFLRSNNSYAM